MSYYIEGFGGLGACLAGIDIQVLLHADNTALISEALEGIQRHLNALKAFCMVKRFVINLDKTKVMVF